MRVVPLDAYLKLTSEYFSIRILVMSICSSVSLQSERD